MGSIGGITRTLFALALLGHSWAEPLAAQECLLIVTSGLDALTVFDLGNQHVSARIPLREEPISVAVSADGRTAFVANAGDNSVSVVDLVVGTTIDVIPVGMFPIDLAVHPDGERLFVSDRSSDRVSIVDIEARQVVDTINVGSGPSDIVIRSDGKRAYVANFRSNNVAVLDLEASRVVSTIPVGEQPFSLALSPDETRLYATNTVSGTLSVIATAIEEVVTTVPVAGFPSDVAVHPDGSSVYVSRAFPDGDVVVVDATSNAVTTTIPVEANAELTALAVSVDGATIFAAEFILGNVFFIDSEQRRLVGFESIGGAGSGPQGIKVAQVPGGCPRPPVPRLATDLGVDDDEIHVDRPDALPIGGTLMIATELVAYRSVFFDRLREVSRGVRGTTPVGHAAGTPAYLVGVPPDANCDGSTGAADLVDIIRQLPSGDAGACGGDVDRNEVVTAADLTGAIEALYNR